MRTIWLLITMDDIQVIGEKPVVSVFASEYAAYDAMRTDILEHQRCGHFTTEEVEYAADGGFAQTRNRRYSWEIAETQVKGG